MSLIGMRFFPSICNSLISIVELSPQAIEIVSGVVSRIVPGALSEDLFDSDAE